MPHTACVRLHGTNDELSAAAVQKRGKKAGTSVCGGLQKDEETNSLLFLARERVNVEGISAASFVDVLMALCLQVTGAARAFLRQRGQHVCLPAARLLCCFPVGGHQSLEENLVC